MVEKIVYECEHCNKKQLKTKRGMTNHEDICWYNTKNKTCVTCTYGFIGYNMHEDKTQRKCFKDNKEGELLRGIEPIVECENWQCSDEYVNEEDIQNIEPPTNEYIREICLKFNELDYWCSINFLCDTEILYLLVKENDDLKSLVHKDNIENIELKDGKLNIEFVNEDENGFTGFTIDKHGIEY